MDTSMDHPNFDFQSTHLSFEERRWLHEQWCKHQLNKSIIPVLNLHKSIRGYQQFCWTASNSSLITKPSIDDNTPIYYPNLLHGSTGGQLDEYRIYYRQMFQLLFYDLSTDPSFGIFATIIEGLTFYSSQTVKEYTSQMVEEIREAVSSLETYVKSRTKKIMDLTLSTQITSLSCYTTVQNLGQLFQLLPKLRYNYSPQSVCNSIVVMDDYAKHTISPEELRFIDYRLKMKSKRHSGPTLAPTNHIPLFGGTSVAPLFGAPPQKQATFTWLGSTTSKILHSLPIQYPYDEAMVYNQKYPQFWTGNAHTNETSEALFHCVPIEKGNDEFAFVYRLFHQTVPESDLTIVAIERIQNAHLWEKFCSHRSYMRRKNTAKHLEEQWLFHGTNSDNHHHIMAHGFNRSYCRDHVLFGRGVYFSRYALYSCHYSDRHDLSFIFLCRVLIGYHIHGANDIHVPPMITLPNGKQIQADSTTDHKQPYTIVCTFHDDQNYPEYMITYMAKNT